jgi:DNA polymerase-3 subunit gamma/tau
LGEIERTRGRALATTLSMRVLSRTWQMLLKGVAEVEEAGRPLAAAEMVLVRIAYVADLPTPDEAIRALDNGDGGGAAPRPSGNGGGAGGGAVSAAASSQAPRYEAPRGAPRAIAVARPAAEPVVQATAQTQSAPRAQAAPAMVIRNFAELVALAADKRDIQMKLALERDIRLVRCEDGQLEIALEQTASKVLVNDLSRKLQLWTGRPWVVVLSREQGEATLKSVADAEKAELEIGVRADPLVKAVLERFPGAEIVRVRGQKDAAQEPSASEPADVPLPDDSGFGDNWERDDE